MVVHLHQLMNKFQIMMETFIERKKEIFQRTKKRSFLHHKYIEELFLLIVNKLEYFVVAFEDILLILDKHEMIDLMRLMINHNYTKFENVQMRNEELVHMTSKKRKEIIL